MNGSLSLDGAWKIRACDDLHGRPKHYIGPGADLTHFVDAVVPGEVHLDLMRAGIIEDTNLGTAVREARWVEESVWVYRREFDAPPEALEAKAIWLVFDGLDLNAKVYLNGEEVGRHDNAHTPCRIDVAGKLKPGTNTVAVWLESGLFAVCDRNATAYEWWSLNHMLHKRAWLRKPQYQFGWDWNPRLINVGIWRPVRLEWSDAVRIEAVTVYSELAGDHATATLHCRVFADNVTGEDLPAIVKATCPETGAVVEVEALLPPGESRQDLEIPVDAPKLWWPLGHGNQPLYTVDIEVRAGDDAVAAATRRTGIRTVTINQEPHPDQGRHFIIEVNGRPIFLKGGNWVPPDMIYARITGEHCRRLIELAVEANCNMMRIWGGGLFADHAMLDACDELGVLVWHDFLYACAKYPADDFGFLRNAEAEAVFAIRDLSHHPSLALWCGNNEVEEGFYNWETQTEKPLVQFSLFHHVLPILLKREDPSRPYWPGSPFSPDHDPPSSKLSGDQHPWAVTVGEQVDNIWHSRLDVSRCANEGGVLGASPAPTVREFLPADQQTMHSPAWVLHDNAVNFYERPGVCYQMMETWIGRVATEMDLDDYLFYSALMQAEGLKEYIDNFRRRMFSSSAAVFWMYNDSWPTTHSWTVLDYHLRRKLSFYPTRRAFAPVTVIPADLGDAVGIFGVNDTPAPWSGGVRYGLASLAGGLPLDERAEVELPANAAIELARIPMAKWREVGTRAAVAFSLLLDGEEPIAQNRLFVEKFKDLDWSAPEVTVRREGDEAVFSSPTFAWGVCLDLDGEVALPDNAFDLLPGIDYRLPCPAEKPLGEIVRIGNLPTAKA